MPWFVLPRPATAWIARELERDRPDRGPHSALKAPRTSEAVATAHARCHPSAARPRVLDASLALGNAASPHVREITPALRPARARDALHRLHHPRTGTPLYPHPPGPTSRGTFPDRFPRRRPPFQHPALSPPATGGTVGVAIRRLIRSSDGGARESARPEPVSSYTRPDRWVTASRMKNIRSTAKPVERRFGMKEKKSRNSDGHCG